MKRLIIHVGTDSADHSVGTYYESYAVDESLPEYVKHYKELAKKYAWLTVHCLEIKATHESVFTPLFVHFNPIQKKIVLDPKKKKSNIASLTTYISMETLLAPLDLPPAPTFDVSQGIPE